MEQKEEKKNIDPSSSLSFPIFSSSSSSSSTLFPDENVINATVKEIQQEKQKLVDAFATIFCKHVKNHPRGNMDITSHETGLTWIGNVGPAPHPIISLFEYIYSSAPLLLLQVNRVFCCGVGLGPLAPKVEISEPILTDNPLFCWAIRDYVANMQYKQNEWKLISIAEETRQQKPKFNEYIFKNLYNEQNKDLLYNEQNKDHDNFINKLIFHTIPKFYKCVIVTIRRSFH